MALAVDRWMSGGGSIVMLTLTMRHSRRDRLDALWGALSSSWASVTAGRLWQAEKDTHDVGGWLRVVESTQGANGWHLHVHALLFVRHEVTDAALGTWKHAVFGRWDRALKRAGLRSASIDAQDMHTVQERHDALAGYFTKAADHGAAIALEFTQSASKKSRNAAKGRTPWDILDAVIGTGDADELELWHEWESASKGRRQLTWSRGLREELNLGEEATDEQIADEELGDSSDNRIEIPADSWRLVCRRGDLAPLALQTLETAGTAATIALLRSAGVVATWVESG